MGILLIALAIVALAFLAAVPPGEFRVAGRDSGKIVIEREDGSREKVTDHELNALLQRDKSPEQRIEELSDQCAELAGVIESSEDLPEESVGAAVAPIVEALIGLGILGADTDDGDEDAKEGESGLRKGRNRRTGAK